MSSPENFNQDFVEFYKSSRVRRDVELKFNTIVPLYKQYIRKQHYQHLEHICISIGVVFAILFIIALLIFAFTASMILFFQEDRSSRGYGYSESGWSAGTWIIFGIVIIVAGSCSLVGCKRISVYLTPKDEPAKVGEDNNSIPLLEAQTV